MRTLVIGDIHGGFLALIEVLENAKITQNDTLIFLGDYVDGWSQSPQVIDFLINLSIKNNCIFIRGNHDQLFLDWLETNDKEIDQRMWYKHGGEATVLAYQSVSELVKKEHIEFLKSLKNYYIDSQNRLFVHAGFTNMNGVAQEYFHKLLYWDRTLWEAAICMDTSINKDHLFYPKRFANYTEIYIGHTPVTRLGTTIPVNKANIWNIDTGAAFKGPLTIMDVDTKIFWQSENLPDLYTNEIGRN